ncbi:hypothetical protein [Methylophilus sp. YYY-1]|uniref:hypothetical protein n=1 Tax=Methylophilus sp. YYY-1 TaxID=2682087 RepID=UPI0023B2F222|nr:hypothetical protein [Methylophilus sp. YYY-1]
MNEVLILGLLFLPALLLFALPSMRNHLGLYFENQMYKSGALMYVMTPGQARVIDPILSTAAQGYKNADYVGQYLFPTVPVDQRGGKIITFGKEDFMLYNTGRAPGGATKRVNYGYQGAPYALEQHSLEGQVPFELMQDANQVPGIDTGKMAVNKTQNIIALRLEKAQADLATNPANYAASNKRVLSGTDMFDNASSKPASIVSDAIETVRSKVGKRANTVVIGAAVFADLKNHPEVIDRIKYTGRDVVTAELLAALWDVKRVYVGDAVWADDQGTFNDVWGKSVVVAYTEIGQLQDQGLPSYGYTYQLRNFPIVEEPYVDRNAKSWIYPVTDEVQPVIAGALSGFLMTNVVG